METFKFGPSDIYRSQTKAIIAARIGNHKALIEAQIVDADIPLLIGTDYMRSWRISLLQDGINKRANIYIHKFDEKFPKNENGHWYIPVKGYKEKDSDVKFVYANEIDSEENEGYGSDEEKRCITEQEISKIHKQQGHKSADDLMRFFKNSSVNKKV